MIKKDTEENFGSAIIGHTGYGKFIKENRADIKNL